MLFLVKLVRALCGQPGYVGPPDLRLSSRPVSSSLGGPGL